MMNYRSNQTRLFFKNRFFKVTYFHFRAAVHVDLQKCAII